MQSKIFNMKNAANTLSTIPIGEVSAGEKFKIEIGNSFGKSFSTVKEFDDFMNSEEKTKSNHLCTGPVWVKGVGKNQSLAVQICDIEIKAVYQCNSYSTGFKKADVKERNPHIYIPDADGRIKINEYTYISPRPSIGYIATINDVPMRGGRCSKYGGNLDFAQLHKGTIIYLPHNHNKALLGVGDVHFRQANGEVSGLALEADAIVELQAFACEKIDYPIIETSTQIVIVGTGNDTNSSMKSAFDNAIDYLKKQPCFDDVCENQLYQLMGGCGHLTPGNLFGKTPSFAIVFFKDVICSKENLPILQMPKIINTEVAGLQKILLDNVKKYKKLKLFHNGDSRQLREISNYPDLLIGKLNPTIYSFVEKKAISAPKTHLLRAQINQHLSDYLKKKGIKTSTLATYKNYVLMTKENAASQIEIIVKAAFIGSSKHTYPNLMHEKEEHAPYVRFDWRQSNPNEDVMMPEGLANRFIDTEQAKQTVLKAFIEIKKYLNKFDLTIYDACFFLNKDGDVLCAEVSPDQMGTLSYIGNNPEYIKVFKERSKNNIYKKWKIMAELLGVNNG